MEYTTENMMLTTNEIISTLEAINNTYFHINDLTEYANKINKLGEAKIIRGGNSELLSYVLYYNNGPYIFISMIWTHPEHRNKGFAKKLIIEIINSSQKDILLEVNPINPAKYLYEGLKFRIENTNGENLMMRFKKSLSIMQPYIFPYIGYFHLIESTDKIVFYDDVNFIKGGWINRNRILVNNSDYMFTIPLKKASPNKLINEVYPLIDVKFKNTFFKQIDCAYKKAPHYDDVSQLLIQILNVQHESIADLAIDSIISIYTYLGKEIKWTKSSICSPNSKGMEKSDRVIQITKDNGYLNYINVIGGKELYNKEYFNAHGVNLNFVQSILIDYKQFNYEFIPWLSIIDLLMFNDIKSIKQQLSAYNVL